MVNISIRIDDPELPAPQFGLDGLASLNTVWIRDGVVERLRHDRYWAGCKGTGPDPLLFPIFMEGEVAYYPPIALVGSRDPLLFPIFMEGEERDLSDSFLHLYLLPR